MVTEAGTRRKTRSEPPAAEGLLSLLVAVDLTPSSDRVIGRLALLPIAPHARVTLLHIVPDTLSPGEQRSAVRDASKALAEEVRHLRATLPKKVRIEPLVKVGAAAKEIARHADALQADLIVMGRGGGRTLRDAFVGSTAERVIRQVQRPVLVVRLPPRAAYGRPALALDLDQAADEVLRLMLHVLPAPRPWVDVIHAFDTPYATLIYPSLPETEANERRSELSAHARQKLAKHLAAALAEAEVEPEDRPYWKIHVRHGSPRFVVEKVLKKADTDLLVLGTHGYTGTAYVLLGTVAGDLLRAAKCDVLVVPPPSRRR